MTPADLKEDSFKNYPSAARSFAVQHLALLRQFPLAVCPSFLVQVASLDTRFPRERETLEWQFHSLETLTDKQRNELFSPLHSLRLPDDMARMNWVDNSAVFVEKLAAVLWSSGQINVFHAASRTLFDAMPSPADNTDRLLLIVLGRDADTSRPSLMKKLARKGLRLEAVDKTSAQEQILNALTERAKSSPQSYAHWYVDGGSPWMMSAENVVQTSYPGLSPLRMYVLDRMRAVLRNGQSGAEMMRSVMAESTTGAMQNGRVSTNPVLQRFYAELFTEGSGTQVFSTSFVQWAGRELARRAQPATVLLRYAPRQHHRGLNEMVEDPSSSKMDPQGSLVDAEMNAFYNWIAMNRITSPGRLTTLAWAEGSSRAVLIGPKTQPNTLSKTPITIAQALRAMQSA